MAQKNDNFKRRFIKKKKKRFVATPLLTKNWRFWTCVFETKYIYAEEKSIT